MSQEETPKPSAHDQGLPALDAAPPAPAAPEPMRAPSPLGPDQAVSGGEHVVQPAGEAAQASGDAAHGAPAQSDQPHRRRRRRRRHRKGPPLNGASSSAPAGAAPSGDGAADATNPGETAASDAQDAGLHFSESGRPILSLPEAAPAPAVPGAPAQPGEHKRRRRRRRRKRPEGAAPLQASGEAGTGGGENVVANAANGTAPASEGNTGERPPRARSPRHRRRRDRRDGAGPRTNDGAPREGGNDRAPREGASRDDRPRRDRDRGDRGERGDRERGPRDGKKRFGKKPGFGQGRDDRRPKEPPKLYSFESIVDRGFEDVADPANDGATRRVDWQIVKRTVADQKSAKPVSAVYLLRREGVDTDFANLAAARQAVNKTIVHPEKLTRPKADYPSTKK